jgi:hypothetical protein
LQQAAFLEAVTVMDKVVEVEAATVTGAMTREATLMEMAVTPAEADKVKVEAKAPRQVDQDPKVKAREDPKVDPAPRAMETAPRVVAENRDLKIKARAGPKVDPAPRATEVAPTVVALTEDPAPKAMEAVPRAAAPMVDPTPRAKAREDRKVDPAPRAMEVVRMDPHLKAEAAVVHTAADQRLPKEKAVPGRRATEAVQHPRVAHTADQDPGTMVRKEAVAHMDLLPKAAKVAQKARDSTCILREIKVF